MTAVTRKSQAGFTLMETMLSVLLLALGLGAAAVTYQVSMRWAGTSRAEMTALHQARGQMERIRTLTWDNAGLSAGTYTFSQNGFTGTYAVVDVSTSLKDIEVSLVGVDPAGRSVDRVRLTTTIAKPLHK
jgi:prepilin-type N-terminal cleavage/methylation domain-containing protein